MHNSELDRLRQDLRHVVDDLEQVVRAAAHATSDEALEIKAQAREQLHVVRLRLADMEHDAATRLREAADRANGYVREHPWAVIGGVATVAFLLGLLVKPRR